MTNGTYQTSLTYADAYSAVVTDLLTKGATIEQKEPTIISGYMVRHKKPSIVLGVILLCFFLIPGIFYFVLAGGDVRESFFVQIGQNPGEPTTLRVGGEGKAFYPLMRTMELLPR